MSSGLDWPGATMVGDLTVQGFLQRRSGSSGPVRGHQEQHDEGVGTHVPGVCDGMDRVARADVSQQGSQGPRATSRSSTS
eukprot:12934790-Prorocentrum_lima.AAC.1